MPDNRDKDRRREIKFSLREKQRAELLATLPMPVTLLQELLDHLDETLFEEVAGGNVRCLCDHTRRRSMSFLREHGIDEAAAGASFDSAGGYCDCEIAANVPTACELILKDE